MKINGIKIPKPESDVIVEEQEIAVKDRTVNGRMVKDIKAIKNIFRLPYRGLFPEDAATFISFYRLGQPVNFEYDDFEGNHVKQVYIESLPREIYKPKPIYTKNITITLEEV